MATKIEVQKRGSNGVDIHAVDDTPDALTERVNEALSVGQRFVVFDVPEGKKLSVIAENVNAIWEE